MFKDRRVAQSAAEILRKHLNLNSTTPYHRSLRAAINLAIAKTKVRHPGNQAKVTVDSSKKLLKCFIRPDISNPGKWIPAEKDIPIPPNAMDPSTRDTTGMTLPTSPVSKIVTPAGRSPSGSDKGGRTAGGDRSSIDEMDALSQDSNLPPLPEFMQDTADSRRKSVFGGTTGKTPRTPPPSSGKSGHASSGGDKS
jgi:hypothetical protein